MQYNHDTHMNPTTEFTNNEPNLHTRHKKKEMKRIKKHLINLRLK